MRSHCRTKNPERGERVKVRFLDTNKVNGMRKDKVLKFSAPG